MSDELKRCGEATYRVLTGLAETHFELMGLVACGLLLGGGTRRTIGEHTSKLDSLVSCNGLYPTQAVVAHCSNRSLHLRALVSKCHIIKTIYIKYVSCVDVLLATSLAVDESNN